MLRLLLATWIVAGAVTVDLHVEAADPNIRPNTIWFIDRDGVEFKPADPKIGTRTVATLHRGCPVRVRRVEGERVLVTLPEKNAYGDRWIQVSDIAKAKPRFAKDDARDAPGITEKGAKSEDIYGTWRVRSVETDAFEYRYDKEANPNQDYEYWRFSPAGAVQWGEGDPIVSRWDTLRIDPTKTPREMDLLRTTPTERIHFYGIYTFDGDRLIWIRGASSASEIRGRTRIERKRDTGFRTLPGDGRVRWIFERVTDDKIYPPDD